MGNRPAFVLMLLCVLAAGAARGAEPTWITSWATAILPAAGPAMPGMPGNPHLANQTLRQVVRLSAGGRQLRLKLSNEAGTQALRIGAATVAVAAADGTLGPAKRVSFGGHREAIIPPGAPLLSDPVDLALPALATVSVSLYFPDDSGTCSCHAVGLQDGFISPPGDFTEASFTAQETTRVRAFLSAVEVDAPGGHTIVVLGDSISDGVGSTPNANHRWPDLLAERLAARGRWGVANEGISGNRILEDGAGVAALARFDRDVLGQAGVRYLIVFEGVNDLGISYGHPEGPMAERFRALMPAHKATAERLIGGLQQIIARAHAHGIKVLGATIAPYERASYWAAEGDREREAVNQWIRTSKAFDGVLDFDAAFRDPAHPAQIAAGLHAGDHLHGSDAGYAAIVKAIDLSLFR